MALKKEIMRIIMSLLKSKTSHLSLEKVTRTFISFNFSVLKKIADNQPKLIFRMIFEYEEEYNKIKPFAVYRNEENFDKLEQELKNIR